jgi:hypothetical protein
VLCVAIVWGSLLTACFHHRQTVVEYTPLSTSPYK